MSTADKRDLLLTYERQQAKRLARMIIDRPKPPLWMIFVPVFFVFFAWKMKEYKNSIASFAANWMITRERCLDAACTAIEAGAEPRLEPIVTAATEIPASAVAPYREWISLLTGYYCRLLEGQGDSARELIGNHCRNRSNYLLTLRQISSSEQVYHQALLPSMPGDASDLQATIEKISASVATLQREQADAIFL